jgi:NitT/TauT family transport system substrate-binding protein
MRLVRPAALAACLAALLCLGRTDAGAQALTKIHIISVPIDVAAEPYYAVEMGFFKAAGIDAEVSSMANGPAIIAALVAGSVEFGSGGTVSIATAHEKGIPIVVAAPAGFYTDKTPSEELVVAKTSTIAQPKDLNGKTIAVSGLKTIAEASLHAWADKNGVDFSSLHLIEMPSSAMDDALAAGRIDAADLSEPVLSAALAAHSRAIASIFSAIAPEWMEGAFFCTADYAKAHPDIVRKFNQVIAQTAVWANAHHDETAQILAKYTKIAPSPTMNRVIYKDRLRLADLQLLIDAGAKYGLLTKSFPASEIVVPGLGS